MNLSSIKSVIGMTAVIILVSCDPQATRPTNNNIPQPQEQEHKQKQEQVQPQKQVQAPTDPNQLIAIKRKELAKLQKELAEINSMRALNKMTRKQNPWLDDAYADMPVHPLESQDDLFDYETVEIQGKISVIQAEIYGLQQIIMNQPTH